MTEPEQFVEQNLRGARFIESDLSGVVMRGVDVAGMDIDAPWLSEGGGLLVNGVDVTSYVEQQLDRRLPGRETRRAADPAGLRDAWETAVLAWDAAIERATAAPVGTVDVRVGGEWSFAETLRHLVHATDLWLGQAVLGLDDPLHPLGVRYASTDHGTAPFDEVLAARASRVALVRDFLATVTDDELAEERPHPHRSDHPETVRHCVHVVLEESWEHLRFALRDLAAAEQTRADPKS